MRKGATEEIVIEDLTFHCLRARGPRRRYMKALLDAGLSGDMKEDGVRIGGAVLDAADVLMREVIVKVEGWCDAAGKALEWTPDDLDELPADVVERLREMLTGTAKAGTEAGNADSESVSAP